MSRLIFFVVQPNGRLCSTSTQAKKTAKVSELNTIAPSSPGRPSGPYESRNAVRRSVRTA
jgi:hypothetical protein